MATNSHGLAGGRLRHDIAKLIGLVAQRLFHGLDCNRHVLKVQRAGFLARRRADTTGDSGNCWSGAGSDRLIPVVVIDEIVPVRDLVVHRAARRPVAVWNAAIHAARRLLLHSPSVIGMVNSRKWRIRSDAGWYFATCRSISRKPVTLPILFSSRCARLAMPCAIPGAQALRFNDGSYSAATPICMRSISSRARRYSTGMTFTNFGR